MRAGSPRPLVMATVSQPASRSAARQSSTSPKRRRSLAPFRAARQHSKAACAAGE